MTSDKKLLVFLSHASQDKVKVRNLFKRLHEDGFDPWLDEERLLPGQDWNLEIEKALRASDAILLCFSASSVAKEGYIQKEYKRAMKYLEEKPEGTIFIIPVRLDNCEVPYFLKHLQWVDLFSNEDYELIMKALRRREEDFIIKKGDPALISIPAGTFNAGVDPAKYHGSLLSDAPYRQVALPAYAIAKYPVTVAEYRAFVRAGGYKREKERYWSKDGWSWRKANKIEQPLLWDDRTWTGNDKLPVVGVSWYEAVAYCHWLSETIGDRRYRLPSQAEWEKAARGTDGRLFPYGDALDVTRCNVAEAGIGHTTPVDQFTAGASPYGVVDMSGNVLEWCASRFIPGQDTFLEQGVLEMPSDRTLRGGGWAFPGKDSRCTLSLMAKPFQRDEHRGFRIACDMA